MHAVDTHPCPGHYVDVSVMRLSVDSGLPAVEVALGRPTDLPSGSSSDLPSGPTPLRPGLYSFEVLRGGVLSPARHVAVLEDPLAAMELLELVDGCDGVEAQEAALADVAYVVEALSTGTGRHFECVDV